MREGVIAAQTLEVIKNMSIKGFANCRADLAANRATHQATKNGTCSTTNGCASRPKQRTSDTAELSAT